MVTKKCLRASAASRQGCSSYLALLKAGESARLSGKGADECPYAEGDDRRETWMDGFTDFEEV